MKIVRMTFDIALKDGAPDVYDSSTMIRRAICMSPIVAGVEVLPDSFRRDHAVNARQLIDKQILDGQIKAEAKGQGEGEGGAE